MPSGLWERISSPVRITASGRPWAPRPLRPSSAVPEPRSEPGWGCGTPSAARTLLEEWMTDGERTMSARRTLGATLVALLAACGGGGSGGSGAGPPAVPPPYSAVTLVQLSQASSFAAGCDGGAPDGTLYPDT